MGAIIVSVMVIVIALASLIYFNHPPPQKNAHDNV